MEIIEISVELHDADSSTCVRIGGCCCSMNDVVRDTVGLTGLALHALEDRRGDRLKASPFNTDNVVVVHCCACLETCSVPARGETETERKGSVRV